MKIQHWELACIDFGNKKFIFRDSYHNNGDFYVNHLREYLIRYVHDTVKDTKMAKKMEVP